MNEASLCSKYDFSTLLKVFRIDVKIANFDCELLQSLKIENNFGLCSNRVTMVWEVMVCLEVSCVRCGIYVNL